MPKGEELNALLFLEGLQVPFIGATIATGVNIPCSASIDVVPTDTIRNILPRTLVHICWKDPTDQVFKLIFEGEVWGKSFTRSPNGRGMQLIAFGYDFHWSSAKRYYIDPLQSDALGIGMNFKIMTEEGANPDFATTPFGDMEISEGTESSMINDLMTETEGEKSDGEVNYLSRVINSSIVRLSERFPYYKMINERFKVNGRITTATTGNIKKIFEFEVAKNFLKGIVSGAYGGNNLRETIMQMMDLIHHNYISLAAPSCENLLQSFTKINSFIFKPDSYVLPPPRCNVFFPDNYTTFNYSHRYDQDPTRLQYSMPAEVVEQVGQEAASYSMNFYTPPELANNLLKMAEASGDETDIFKKRDCYYNYLTFEEKFRGIVHGTPPNPPYISQLLRDEENFLKYASDVANYEYYKQKYNSRSVSISSQVDPWLVPGFPSLIIDNSKANQHIIAHINTVELRINATEGGYTAVTFSEPRELDSFSWTEKMQYDNDLKKIISDKIDEPPIPKWFDEEWGVSSTISLKDLKVSLKIDETTKTDIMVTVNKFPSIDNKYIEMLGLGGGESIIGWQNELKMSSKTTFQYNSGNTIIESAYRVIDSYKKAKEQGNIFDWINKFKARKLTPINDAFNFIGASTKQNINAPDPVGVRYTGEQYILNMAKEGIVDTGDLSYFDGYSSDENGVSISDIEHVKLRRSVIEAYRKELSEDKGFMG